MVCAKTNVSTVILITCSLFAFIHYFSTIQSNLLQRKHTTNTLISKEYVNTKYIEDINKQVSHNKNLSTSTDKLAYNGDVYLNIFDSARYEAGQKNDTQAPNTCVKTGLKPIYFFLETPQLFFPAMVARSIGAVLVKDAFVWRLQKEPRIR